VLTGNRLLASMPAVGVMPLELAWTADLLAGGHLLGLAAYMFDAKLPAYLRALSLFHLFLPPTLVYLLWRLGYDHRALVGQTLIAWAALAGSYVLTDPAQFGPGEEPQHVLPPLVYLLLEMAAIPVLVMLPVHEIFKPIFSS
jgi:hypothetical protein